MGKRKDGFCQGRDVLAGRLDPLHSRSSGAVFLLFGV